MPVYRLNYRFKKKDYNVAVNGNTGRITGKTPVSPLRVTIAVLLGLALVFGLGYLATKCDEADGYDYYGYADETVCRAAENTQSYGAGEYRILYGGKELSL